MIAVLAMRMADHVGSAPVVQPHINWWALGLSVVILLTLEALLRRDAK